MTIHGFITCMLGQIYAMASNYNGCTILNAAATINHLCKITVVMHYSRVATIRGQRLLQSDNDRRLATIQKSGHFMVQMLYTTLYYLAPS